ncbi:acetyltransferase [Paenibacillus aurantiacus]|uniref:Acetyltransferase n=1 Tax=Paenibacillus aurantiacus TaxID=1936118 RepID=A0ABV5KIS2_9BACL
MNKIVLLGSGGHAKVVIDIVELAGEYEVLGLLDDHRPAGTVVCGYEVLGPLELLGSVQADGCIAAVGDNATRERIVRRAEALAPGLPFVAAVHPKAVIARSASLGEGTVVMAGAVVNGDTSVGKHAIINTNASIDHDSVLGDYVSVAPRAATGGGVRIGSHAAISIGATIIHGIAIGEHAVIGAGATVVSPIESFAVAYGTPARVVRRREAGERYL